MSEDLDISKEIISNTDIGIKTQKGKILNLTGINYFNYQNPNYAGTDQEFH